LRREGHRYFTRGGRKKLKKEGSKKHVYHTNKKGGGLLSKGNKTIYSHSETKEGEGKALSAGSVRKGREARDDLGVPIPVNPF